MIRIAAPLLFLLLAVFPASALAAELRRGETITVGPDEVVEEDLYAFGGTVNVQGTVRGDVVAFGGTVNLGGTVTGDVLAATGTLNLTGEVEGSVRAATGELLVSGPVGEDVVGASGRIDVAKTGTIGGDLLSSAGDVALHGPVGGDLLATGGSLALDAPVRGEVSARVRQLTLSDQARIGGDLSYTSDRDAAIAQGAVVSGGIEHQELNRSRVPLLLFSWARALLGLFALGLIFVLITPSFARRAEVTLRRDPLKSFGVGLATLIVGPILAGFVFLVGALIGGWWIGLIALGLLGVACALCFPLVGLFVGDWIIQRFGKGGVNVLLALLVGLVLITLLGGIPLLGALVVLATIVFGLGALLLAAIQARRDLTLAH
jgi:cytoskeletal protein CcmA (bactofilin family)